MAADAVDVSAVNDIVRHAVEAINVDEEGQTLTLEGPRGQQQQQQQPVLTLNHHDMQYVINLLQRRPRAVENLVMESFSVTRRAVDVLRAYFSSYTRTRKMPLRHISFDAVNLGNVNGGRLLSALHGNNSVMKLYLMDIGLEGQAGGDILSDLLQHNPCLAALCCVGLRLGVEGARALEASLRTNQTASFIVLEDCDLEDEGTSLIVNALLENSTITSLVISSNHITPNGLPHLTQLLQHSSIRNICMNRNPGLFDNEAYTKEFCMALQNSQVTNLNLNFCQLTSHVMAALFRSLSAKTTPTYGVGVYDFDQIQGAYLVPLLEIIPQMRTLSALCVNIDFMNESVLSSFHRNTSFFRLYKDNSTSTLRVYSWSEIESEKVLKILKRNRWLDSTSTLLASSEPQQTVPLGLWSKAMERLTHDDSTGVTAVYKIMQEKLVMWVFPYQEAVEAPMMVSIAAATAPLIAASAAAHVVVGAVDDEDAAASYPPSSSTMAETDAGLLTTKNHDSDKASTKTKVTTTNKSTVGKCSLGQAAAATAPVVATSAAATNAVSAAAALHPPSSFVMAKLTTEKNGDCNEALPTTANATPTNGTSTAVAKKRPYAQANNATMGDNNIDGEAPPLKKTGL